MYKKYTLSNNVRVILAPLSNTKSATVEVWFGVGSRYEAKRINGISHFIEHMMFKGTKRRPTKLALTKELDGVGALYNAFTSKEVTGYWVKISADKLDLALDIVSDMLYNSAFAAREIEREKSVICEEQHMHRDNPMIAIYDALESLMFSASPLGWDIGGPDAVIRSLTREDLMRFRDAHYHGRNLIIGIAGNIDVEKTYQKVARFFGASWEMGAKANRCKPHRRHAQNHPRIALQYKETEQVQIDLGFHGYAFRDSSAQTAAVLAAILGGTMSSRLFLAIRDRRGLCYSIHAGHESFQDAGLWYIQAGLEKTRMHEALRAIMAELRRVREGGVTAAELSRAKENAKGHLALSWEDSEHVVSWYVSQEHFTKKLLTPEEKLKKLFAITRDDVHTIARRLFQTKNINLAIIGPYKDAKEFFPLLKI